MGARFNNFKQNVKIQEVKKHFEEHKEAYIAGGCGVALGAIAGLLRSKPVRVNNTVSPEIKVEVHVERGHDA